MSHDSDVRHVPLPELVFRCEQEIARYLKKKPCNPCYCYELFRRAIQDGNQEAWDALVRIYTPLALMWINRHPAFPATNEEAGFFVNGAFMRMAMYMTPAKFIQSRDLAAVLKYLKLCIHSEIMAYLDRVELAELDEERPGDELPEEAGDLDLFWNLVTARLHSDQERQIMTALYRWGLKPRQVPAVFPQAAQNVEQVYRVCETVLERLKRDGVIQAWVNDYVAPEK